MKIQIYSLSCPIIGDVKYIGKTKNSLSDRLSAHLSYKGDNVEKSMWIESLKQKGLKPKISLIELVEEYNWEVKEQYWISFYLSKGAKLFNQSLDKNDKFFVINQYQRELKRLNYSKLTAKNYTSCFTYFLVDFAGHRYTEIPKEKIVLWLQSLVDNRNISSSYQNVLINSVKFFYEKVLGYKQETYYIKRPKREDKLRPLMPYEDVLNIIDSISYLKQRTCLQLMYSCALRSSEVVSVQLSKIDWTNKRIHLYQGKGKKDRIISVPEQTLNLLQKYIQEFKPEYWLFEGQTKGEHYSQRSLQIVFDRQKKLLGLNSEYRPHDMRGARLTHVMNNGVKIENAAKYAGHETIHTIYKSYYRHVVDEMQEQFEMADIEILKKFNTQKQLR